MLTVHTCPTSDLEELCKRFDPPKTLEESAMLYGAQSALANRFQDNKKQWGNDRSDSIKQIEKRILLLRSGLTT